MFETDIFKNDENDVEGKYLLCIITWDIDVYIGQTGFINQQCLMLDYLISYNAQCQKGIL